MQPSMLIVKKLMFKFKGSLPSNSSLMERLLIIMGKEQQKESLILSLVNTEKLLMEELDKNQVVEALEDQEALGHLEMIKMS